MNIEVVQADQVDKGEYVSSANSAFPGRSTSEDELEWKWAHNGFGRPTIVVARDERGRLLGSLVFGAMRLRGPLGPVSARLSYDTFVVPKARGQGVFGRMLREAPAALLDCDVAFNFPNKGSAPGFRRSGWIPVQRVPQHSTFLTPGRGGQVDDVEPGCLADASILSFSSGARDFGWMPGPSHVDWRLRRPGLETRLLHESEVTTLVSVHQRRGIAELRVLEVWGRPPGTKVLTSIGRMARFLKCGLVTYPIAGTGAPGRLRLGLRGWVARPSRAELYVWNGSSPGACDGPWVVSGGMFHTW
jgi:GNAT superfamily N-acetyltransferase